MAFGSREKRSGRRVDTESKADRFRQDDDVLSPSFRYEEILEVLSSGRVYQSTPRLPTIAGSRLHAMAGSRGNELKSKTEPQLPESQARMLENHSFDILRDLKKNNI
jgi:hypothetical protein